jgi:hypothetical protein
MQEKANKIKQILTEARDKISACTIRRFVYYLLFFFKGVK